MKRVSLILAAVACFAAAGCDNKETRKGSITLTGAAGIPLNDKSGAHAELAAGPAEITFQKGSQKGTIAIAVKQAGRPDVNIEAPLKGDPTQGDFTLRGSEIGQPVDLVSARRFTVTGPNQRWSHWEDQGFERCLIEDSFDPCNESWTVTFRAAAGDVGAFAAHTASRCNERNSQSFCQPVPGREPRIPDFPRGPHGRGVNDILTQDPSSVKFD
jgi:hypothetical protein